MTFDLHKNWQGLSPQCGAVTGQLWDSSILSQLRYYVYKVFRVWPEVTSNDLWPLPKIGINYSMRNIHRSSMRFMHVCLLEILHLQGFQTLTSGDLKWRLTSTKNNRDHVLNMCSSYAKYEIHPLPFLRYCVYKVFGLWPLVTLNDFELHQKQ